MDLQKLPPALRLAQQRLAHTRLMLEEALALATQANLAPVYLRGIQKAIDDNQAICLNLSKITNRLERTLVRHQPPLEPP